MTGIGGIRSVEANVLTGSLLVQYALEKPLEEIVGLIAEHLRMAPPPAATRSTESQSKPDTRERAARPTKLRQQRPGIARITSPGAPGSAGVSVQSHSGRPAGTAEISSDFRIHAPDRLNPTQAAQPPSRYLTDVAPEADALSKVSVVLKQVNSAPRALLVAPPLVAVPLGFLRIFSVGLFHASPILTFLMLLIILLGQIVGKKEGWSKADALYFSFVTATTVGYGDLHPTKPSSRALAVTIGFVGIIFTGILTAIGLHSAQSAFAKMRPSDLVS